MGGGAPAPNGQQTTRAASISGWSAPARLLLVLLCALSLAAPASQALELRRGPYLLNQRPDGITVRWRTSGAEHTSLLRWGATPWALDQTVAAQRVGGHFPSYQEWEARLDSLAPDTQYFYALEADQAILVGADQRHFFRTAPTTGQAAPLRFWLLGDSGSNRPRAGSIEKALGATGPTDPVRVRNGFRRFGGDRRLDGLLLLGDNAYPLGTDAQYQAAFFNIYADELAHTPLWPVAGNHDLDGAFQHIFFTQPAADGRGLGHQYYYSFDLANVHVVVVEAWKSWWEFTTEAQHLPWQRQLAWLEEDLAANTQPWTIVLCHMPLYCDGNYNSDTNGPLVLLRQALVPLLDRYGVDLYLAGHDHTYQRSYLIHGHTGPSTEFDPAVHRKSASTGRGESIRKQAGPHSGTVYVVSGTGGGTRPKGAFAHPVMVPMPADTSAQRGLAQPGSLVLEIDGSVLQGWQIDVEGAVLDHFSLVKEGLR